MLKSSSAVCLVLRTPQTVTNGSSAWSLTLHRGVAPFTARCRKVALGRPRQEDGIFVDVDGSTTSSANSARIVKGQKGTLNFKKNRKMNTQKSYKVKALRQRLESTHRSPSKTLQKTALACLSEVLAYQRCTSNAIAYQYLLGRKPKRNRKAHIKKSFSFLNMFS